MTEGTAFAGLVPVYDVRRLTAGRVVGKSDRAALGQAKEFTIGLSCLGRELSHLRVFGRCGTFWRNDSDQHRLKPVWISPSTARKDTISMSEPRTLV